MKKAIITISLIGSLLIFLDSVNASYWLMLFFFAGVIPGTDILISPTDMLAANATAITVVILRITIWPTAKDLFFPQAKTVTPAKKHVSHKIS